MISVGSTLASGAGNVPVGAAAAEEAGRGPKAPAACDCPGSYPGQAASAAAGTDAGNKSDSRVEAARPGSIAGESGAHAATDSAGDAPSGNSSTTAAGRSRKGQPSASDANTGVKEADGSSPVVALASTAVAERSTAHGAPPDCDVWNPTDRIGSKEQTPSSQLSPITQQLADTGSTQRQASSGAHAGQQQAAHDGQDPDAAQKCSCGPSRSAAATGDPLECKKIREGSEGAGAASGGSGEKSQAVSGEPLTPQQHAVVAALFRVMKRAMLLGHEAFRTARERLWRNNPHTLVVLRFINNYKELPNIRDIEHVLRRDDQDLLDLLARNCTAAGFQPLQVFTRSMQCGVMAACTATFGMRGTELPARHQQVAELDRVFAKHSFTVTWVRTTVNLLARQGILELHAELVMLVLLLLVELCKWSFRPPDCQPGEGFGYAALDHLLPGSCHVYSTVHRHAAMVAGIISAMMKFIRCT